MELGRRDDLIVKGFEQCGYKNCDGDYNKLHSHLGDTIVYREVPIGIILQIDEADKEYGAEMISGANTDVKTSPE